ncbi:MAG: VWA domain-containing protein [Polyangiaceae bacterium]|nr:VWA domain-containing protein [Polyangiaceae bacterium]
MSKLKEFTASTARPLPVLLLADVSGSMSTNGKIDALNDAVQEMLEGFGGEDDSRAEIHVSVVTFGKAGAKVHQPLAPASKIQWARMAAAGGTPMGAAFDVTTGMIEDRAQIPSRAYRPTIVLVSDGQPTDDWQGPLKRLLGSERASKAARFAMGIGDDADAAMLAAFLATPDARVYRAHEARQIKQFFRWVTMSVTQRSRSANPDSVIAAEPTDVDDFNF